MNPREEVALSFEAEIRYINRWSLSIAELLGVSGVLSF